jgi:hypothetical protein
MGEDSSPPNPGWLPALGHSDWLKIPGAVKAIAHLVGGAADIGTAAIDIGTAKAEQAATIIRAETEAQARLIGAFGVEAAALAKSNPELAQRAIASWFGDRLRQQENKEAVARLAIEHLSATIARQSNETPGAAEGPTDDWMNIFERHARDASSERLRMTWARVLAGEIRRQGSFSLQTLAFVSILDATLAETVRAVSGCILDRVVIPTSGPFNRGQKYLQLLRLAEAGFLTLGSRQHINARPNGAFVLGLGSSHFILFLGPPGKKLEMRAAGILTRVGLELVDIVDSPTDLSTAEAMIKVWAKANSLEYIIIERGSPLPEPFASSLREAADVVGPHPGQS